MRTTDIEGICDLAGQALSAGGGLIQKMHQGIAERPFGIMGLAAAPARVIHDRVTRSVYGGLRGAFTAASRGAAVALATVGNDESEALTATPAGGLSLAALNGLYGDHLRAQGSPLALGMEIRGPASEVPPTAEALAAAFADATPRIAVFVHGLCETEDSWRHFPLWDEYARRRPYGNRLRDDLGLTPVYLRYNTGLHVSDNGRALSGLLRDLVDGWPTDVEQIVLIGHSMGGLVARSACHYGERQRHAWTRSVRHVFCLGTPHLGADLEKGLNALGAAFGRLPETRAFAALVNARSAGIKALRFGSCVEEDWCQCDPDEFLRDRCQEVPFLDHVNYYFIAASLTRGPVGSLLGDLLVRIPSASGRGNGKGRRIPFEVDNGHELSGLTHFDLLNHPAVYEQIRTWLERGGPARCRAGLGPAA